MIRMNRVLRTLALLAAVSFVIPTVPARAQSSRHAVLDLWTAGKPVFGVFVPNENPQRFERGQPPPKAIYTREGAEKLAANPLLDFVFLNLEGSYDVAAVKTLAEGLRSKAAVGPRKSLLVRIPTIERDGVEADPYPRQGSPRGRRRRRHASAHPLGGGSEDGDWHLPGSQGQRLVADQHQG